MKRWLLDITTWAVADAAHLKVDGDDVGLTDGAKDLRQDSDEIVLRDVHGGEELIADIVERRLRVDERSLLWWRGGRLGRSLMMEKVGIERSCLL